MIVDCVIFIKGQFDFVLSLLHPLFLLYIAVARVSDTVLNKNGESENACLLSVEVFVLKSVCSILHLLNYVC